MIVADRLTKRYGGRLAVDDLSFTVQPGVVTGFLGPNGAGKSTTMRLILGLDRPSSGTATVNGKRYVDQPAPLGEVGALLEAKAVHTSRSARNHLRALAATHRIPDGRIDEVLELVGLTDVAHQRAGAFSLGMGQRLGIAAALLGDPGTLILDEPVNGLDPEGIRWVRDLLRRLASEGRTVFLSSHLMSEMAMTADHLIVIGRGRLLADMGVADLVRRAGEKVVLRGPEPDRLAAAVQRAGGRVCERDGDRLIAEQATSEQIGRAVAAEGAVLFELTSQHASLEEAFMAMTADSVDFHAHEGPAEEQVA
ncbi:MAG TPA: ABC transporter ATP-binding protein [Jatrophihabitans sp.]|nr:ABC transporter ATP-binding protein [Jatrophihabitans sp.]